MSNPTLFCAECDWTGDEDELTTKTGHVDNTPTEHCPNCGCVEITEDEEWGNCILPPDRI